MTNPGKREAEPTRPIALRQDELALLRGKTYFEWPDVNSTMQHIAHLESQAVELHAELVTLRSDLAGTAAAIGEHKAARAEAEREVARVTSHLRDEQLAARDIIARNVQLERENEVLRERLIEDGTKTLGEFFGNQYRERIAELEACLRERPARGHWGGEYHAWDSKADALLAGQDGKADEEPKHTHTMPNGREIVIPCTPADPKPSAEGLSDVDLAFSLQHAHDSAHHSQEVTRILGEPGRAVVDMLTKRYRQFWEDQSQIKELRERAEAAEKLVKHLRSEVAAHRQAHRETAAELEAARDGGGERRTHYAVEHAGKGPGEWVNVSFYGTDDIGAARQVCKTWQEIKGAARIVRVTEVREVLSDDAAKDGAK